MSSSEVVPLIGTTRREGLSCGETERVESWPPCRVGDPPTLADVSLSAHESSVSLATSVVLGALSSGAFFR